MDIKQRYPKNFNDNKYTRVNENELQYTVGIWILILAINPYLLKAKNLAAHRYSVLLQYSSQCDLNTDGQKMKIKSKKEPSIHVESKLNLTVIKH